jgi:hypothetical protein
LITSLDRAKRFIAEKAKKVAITLMPLAALSVAALPAHAGTLGTGSCTTAGGSGSCTITQASATGANPALNWLQLAGSGSTTTGQLFFGTAIGSASGSAPSQGTIPVSWYFEIIDPGSLTIGWSLGANIIGSNSQPGVFPSGSVSSTQFVTGSGLIHPNGGTLSSYILEASFQVQGPPGQGAFSVLIPAGSTIDLNGTTTAGPSGTPEPGSVILMGTGGAALLLLRRRQRSQSRA